MSSRIMISKQGLEDILVKRMDRIPELEAGGQLVRKPIYVCTRNDDLESMASRYKS